MYSGESVATKTVEGRILCVIQKSLTCSCYQLNFQIHFLKRQNEMQLLNRKEGKRPKAFVAIIGMNRSRERRVGDCRIDCIGYDFI